LLPRAAFQDNAVLYTRCDVTDNLGVHMSYYRYHVFFCTNLREDGRACCASRDAQAVRDYAKERVKALGLAGKGGVRVNNAGCLDRCEEGPCVVVYPEGIWYTYVDREDIDEIIHEHLQHGRVVKRLQI
jgi:(2Fe-2S) ferredoxin